MLIINADDFGRSELETDVILKCYHERRITSTTAMVFMADSVRAADLGRAIPIAGTAGARSDGSAAAAVRILAALMKDGRDEANGALSPSRRSAKAGFRWACRWSKG